MKYRRRELPFQEIGGTTFVVIPRTGTLVMLQEESASFLWARLAAPVTLEELAQALVGEFEVDHDTAARDVRGFLEELEAQGLVVPA